MELPSEDEMIEFLMSVDCTMRIVTCEGPTFSINTSDVELVKDVFHQHGMSFAIRSSDANEIGSARLMWSHGDIDYLGMPFKVLKTTQMECIHGIRRQKTVEKSSVQLDQPIGKEKKTRNKPSKKIGCPAIMKITEIVLYPEYTVSDVKRNLVNIKRRKMKELRQILETTAEVRTEKRYYIVVSKPSAHTHEAWTSYTCKHWASQLRTQTKKLVAAGITNDVTLKKLLELFVRENAEGNLPISTKHIIQNYVKKFTSPKPNARKPKAKKSLEVKKVSMGAQVYQPSQAVQEHSGKLLRHGDSENHDHSVELDIHSERIIYYDPSEELHDDSTIQLGDLDIDNVQSEQIIYYEASEEHRSEGHDICRDDNVHSEHIIYYDPEESHHSENDAQSESGHSDLDDPNFSQISRLKQSAATILDLLYQIPSETPELPRITELLSKAEQLLMEALEKGTLLDGS